MHPTVPIEITKLDAMIPEGIQFLWNGSTVNSGPLKIRLDNQARTEGDNRGELDYRKNVARARFNVVIDFTGMAMQPLRAVLHSEGVITEDHNFGLSGPMEVRTHPLFGAEGVSVAVLPGR
jgi:hypothetical protein